MWQPIRQSCTINYGVSDRENPLRPYSAKSVGKLLQHSPLADLATGATEARVTCFSSVAVPTGTERARGPILEYPIHLFPEIYKRFPEIYEIFPEH
jgi:hypothetical protein